MEEILHQYGKYPSIYSVSNIPGGVGFLPSTVVFITAGHSDLFLQHHEMVFVANWVKRLVTTGDDMSWHVTALMT